MFPVPMNDTLARQRMRDVLDALDAEEQAAAYEADARREAVARSLKKEGRFKMRRWVPRCGSNASYCPHPPGRCPR